MKTKIILAVFILAQAWAIQTHADESQGYDYQGYKWQHVPDQADRDEQNRQIIRDIMREDEIYRQMNPQTITIVPESGIGGYILQPWGYNQYIIRKRY